MGLREVPNLRLDEVGSEPRCATLRKVPSLTTATF